MTNIPAHDTVILADALRLSSVVVQWRVTVLLRLKDVHITDSLELTISLQKGSLNPGSDVQATTTFLSEEHFSSSMQYSSVRNLRSTVIFGWLRGSGDKFKKTTKTIQFLICNLVSALLLKMSLKKGNVHLVRWYLVESFPKLFLNVSQNDNQKCFIKNIKIFLTLNCEWNTILLLLGCFVQQRYGVSHAVFYC